MLSQAFTQQWPWLKGWSKSRIWRGEVLGSSRFGHDGRVGGRQRGLSEQAERPASMAEARYREQPLGVNEIAQRLHISKVTRCKYLRPRHVVIHAHRKTAATASDYLLDHPFTQGQK